MHACGRHEASVGLERRLSVDAGAGWGLLGWD